MKYYADHPGVRAKQLLTDSVVLIWCLSWALAGYVVHKLISALAVFGRVLEDAGRRFADSFGGAADRTGGVPLVGDSLSGPFSEARDASVGLVNAGLAEQQAVSRLALALGLVVALAPIAAVLVMWLPRRWTWIKEATAISGTLDDADAQTRTELLALRAAVRQPLAVVQAAAPSAVAALRQSDPDQLRALARLELEAMGLSGGGGRREVGSARAQNQRDVP